MLNHSLSSWCHSLNSRLPPKAGSRGEKSVTVLGFLLQSRTLNLPWAFASDRKKRRSSRGLTTGKNTKKKKKSLEWHRCMGLAAKTWRGQTMIWKESPRGRGGGGVKAKVSTVSLKKLYFYALWHAVLIPVWYVCKTLV